MHFIKYICWWYIYVDEFYSRRAQNKRAAATWNCHLVICLKISPPPPLPQKNLSDKMAGAVLSGCIWIASQQSGKQKMVLFVQFPKVGCCFMNLNHTALILSITYKKFISIRFTFFNCIPILVLFVGSRYRTQSVCVLLTATNKYKI